MISSDELRGEIKKQLDIRRWHYTDLARATGFTEKTVRNYMSSRAKQSDTFERRACYALEIERE